MATTHLLIIGDRDPLRWVVTAQRMAFPPGRSKMVAHLAEGDQVLVYTTRGCFRSPNRDQGRIMARATIVSPIRKLSQPIHFGTRDFTEGCRLGIEALAPYRDGLALRDLVSRLQVFPDGVPWSARLRRPALTLPTPDALLINRELDPYLRPYANVVKTYRPM